MNFSRFFPVLFLLLILAVFSAIAQDTGYVITTRGDTIRCVIDYNAATGRGKYKTDTSKKFVEIAQENIKEFGMSHKRMAYDDPAIKLMTSPYTGKPEYMTMVEKGKIKLYMEIINDDYTSSHWVFPPQGASPKLVTVDESDNYLGVYAEKENSGLIVLESTHRVLAPFDLDRKARKAALLQLIADNDTVIQKFLADKKFDILEIWNIVSLYDTGKPLVYPQNTEKADDDGGLSPDFNPNEN